MSSEEQTLYEVLDLHPRATADEVRAAYARAQEMYGADSIAVYALVDELQIEALRARLTEAAEILLDPARRAGYDRMLGLVPPTTLWAEDDEEDAVGASGPSARSPEPKLTPVPAPPPGEASPPVVRAGSDAPRQRVLPLEISEEPTRLRAAAPETPATGVGSSLGAPEPKVAPEPAPLLANDWAAAVPTSPSAEASDVAAAPPPERRSPGRGLPPPLPRSSSFGLRARLDRSGGRSRPAVPSTSAASPPATPMGPSDPPASVPAAPPSEVESEVSAPSREGRARLEIPPDAEFNGELLRQVREAYGLSLQQVAERTRITRIHLENVEADRYDHLPATVYLRGILVSLARELRLDPARVSKSYLLAASRGMPRGL